MRSPTLCALLLCALYCCVERASGAPRSLLAHKQQQKQVGAGEHSLFAADPHARRRLLQEQQDYAIQTVYFDGFASGWSGSGSYGCDCDFKSLTRPFPGGASGSPAEITAFTRVLPWAAVVLENEQAFGPQVVLDFVAKGSGLERSEFFLENPELGHVSRKVKLSSRDVTGLPEDFLSVRDAGGATGWMNLRMDLRKLTIKPETNWTKIVFRDVSGSGFTLQFAQMRLVAVAEEFNVSTASQQILDWMLVDPPNPGSSPSFGGASSDDSPPSDPVPILNLDTPRSKRADFGIAAADEEPGTEFLMKFKENLPKARLEEICNELSSREMGRFNGFCKFPLNDTVDAAANSSEPLTWRFQAFTVEAVEDVAAMSNTLGDSLEYITKDMIAETSQFDADISSVRSWGLDRIDQTSLPLDGTYNNGRLDGVNSHVYVLDTGVRESHNDFSGRVGESRSLYGGSAFDDNGHGTHVAGTAVGAFHGVARSAILHAVKVLGDDGRGSYSNIIEGLRWVIEHKRRNGINQAVAVLSLGGPKSQDLNDAVEEAVRAGIMVVVAAGNDRGGDACSYSPSSAPNAIVVGASTREDDLASFSNIGGCLTLFGPGAGIISASNRGDTSETTKSGTSMAAPHVAGAVAMFLESRPNADVNTVKQALRRAAPSIRFEFSSPDLLLNAESSRLVESNPDPPPSSPPPTSTPPTRNPPAFDFPRRPSWCDRCSWCMFC